MPNVQISDVELYPLDPERLLGFHIESPTSGSGGDLHSILFSGWIVGREHRVVALEFTGPGLDASRLPVGVVRPDVAAAYPDVPPSMQPTGFRAALSTLGLPNSFALEITAILKDKGRVSLGRILGSRSRLSTIPSPLRPILLTTLGRTGSTLVMKLLSLHPAIAAYPLWRTEPKVASYWADVMLSLTDPRSYLQPVTSTIRGPNWWLGEWRLFDEDFDDPELKEWLGLTHVSEVAGFCRERIVAFYERLANKNDEPTYFAEKCVPRNPSYAAVLREIFPDTREIILVRDFRDMLCSIFAYSDRLGSQLFGRELEDSDEAYIRGNLAKQVYLLSSGWRQRSDSTFLLRYEDLILDPQTTLRSMLDYLDLESSDAILKTLTAGFAYGKGPVGETHGTSSSARESIGRWKTDLDPTLAAVCEEALGNAMEVFGYPVSLPLASRADARS